MKQQLRNAVHVAFFLAPLFSLHAQMAFKNSTSARTAHFDTVRTLSGTYLNFPDAVRITSNFNVAGSPPSVRLYSGSGAGDSRDSLRAHYGLATGSNQFINGTADGDLVIRPPKSGQVVFGRWPSSHANPSFAAVIQSDGTFSFDNTGEAKGLGFQLSSFHTQTTDATATAIATVTPPANSTSTVGFIVVANSSTSASGASYSRTATFRNDGGTVVQVGTTTTSYSVEDVAGWNADFSLSANVVTVVVTGAAATTVEWQASVQTYTISE